MSYGYGLSASLFQLARAYTVFAHDGELIPVTHAQAPGRSRPVAGVRVLSPKTAQAVREMLQHGHRPRRHRAEGADHGLLGRRQDRHRAQAGRQGLRRQEVPRLVRRPGAGEQPAHRRRGDGRRAEQRQVLRRRRGRAGVQPRWCSRRCACWACSPTWTCKPQIVASAVRGRGRRASDGADARCTSPDAAVALAARSACAARCAPTAARVQPGDAFVAWPGAAHDGRRFVPRRAGRGRRGLPGRGRGRRGLRLRRRAHRRAARPRRRRPARSPTPSSARPSRALDVVAVTGTNGKTSHRVVDGAGARPRWAGAAAWSARWASASRRGRGRRAGAAAALLATGLTTPDPVTLQARCAASSTRASPPARSRPRRSASIEQRLAGTRIEVALFTNFTHDHLDYHGDMDAYWAGQAPRCSPGRACARRWSTSTTSTAPRWPTSWRGAALDLWTVLAAGRRRGCARAASRYRDGGLAFDVRRRRGSGVPVRSTLIGDYNASQPAGRDRRACARWACRWPTPRRAVPRAARRCPAACSACGAAATSRRCWSTTPTRPTRWRRRCRRCGRWPRRAAARLWCVFGCGGNRDASKRPLMGAHRRARRRPAWCITSDNPRDEAPAAILAQILAGVPGHDEVDVIEDRRDAIAHAVRQRRRRRRGADRRQGPRGLPGSGRRQAARSPTWSKRARRAAPRGAAGATRDDDAGPGACAAARQRALVGDGADVASSACTPTRAACAPATCSWRCAASASTPTTSCAQARAAGAVAALAERGLADAGLPGLQVADTLAALQQLAAAWRAQLRAAADRGHRQQRQDHGHADDRGHPARLARRRRARHRRQPQQPHRRAADAAAPAPGRRHLAPRRGGRARHEPPGRDRAAGATGRARRWRWSTTRSASTRSSWPAWKRWRARTAA